ncbi:MAG: hypothetical protein AAFY31_05125, partial [Pseudomonadota bacterium]
APAPAPAPASQPEPTPEREAGKVPVAPLDRPAPKRESIKMAVATDQRATLPTSKRKRAKGVVAVEADQQRQIEMDLATQTELILEAPTEADVSELERGMGDLEELKNSLPEVADSKDQLDPVPPFADQQEKQFAQDLKDGHALVQRGDDGEWERVTSDGTEKLGYRDERHGVKA